MPVRRRASAAPSRALRAVGALALGGRWLLALAVARAGAGGGRRPGRRARRRDRRRRRTPSPAGSAALAVDGFGAIIKALFAWPAKLINRELLAWLVAVPDYAIAPATAGGRRHGSNLAELGATTSAMAFAALGAVGTVSASATGRPG